MNEWHAPAYTIQSVWAFKTFLLMAAIINWLRSALHISIITYM